MFMERKLEYLKDDRFSHFASPENSNGNQNSCGLSMDLSELILKCKSKNKLSRIAELL
jgi:hypothetical protein